MDEGEILRQVAAFAPCKLVELTGGEPVLQQELAHLASELLANGYQVLLETNGSLDLSSIPQGVCKIIDFKPPSSQVPANYEAQWRSNLPYIGTRDEIKCVLANRDDFEHCVERLGAWGVLGVRTVLFSAVWGELRQETLVEWILESQLPIRLNLQWHKYIWDPQRRGV